jgi:hypothetical protein
MVQISHVVYKKYGGFSYFIADDSNFFIDAFLTTAVFQ